MAMSQVSLETHQCRIQLSGVRERDIDLFLIEEFTASRPFLKWFLSRVGVQAPIELLEIKQSDHVSEAQSPLGRGESDIVLKIRTGKSTLGVHIEDKIDADLQELQAERYKERAKHCCDRGDYDSAFVVLVAPAKYSATGFEKRISYEDISEYLSKNSKSRRLPYKLELLAAALGKSKTGSTRWSDSEESFLARAKKNLSLNELEALTTLLHWATNTASDVRFGSGCFLPLFYDLSKRPVFEVHSDARIKLNFTWLDPKYEPRYSDEVWRAEFQEKLRQASFRIPKDCIKTVSLNPSQWILKLREFTGIIEEMNQAT